MLAFISYVLPIPKSARGWLLLSIPFIICGGLLLVVASHAWDEFKMEALFRLSYGAEWQQHFEEAIGPVSGQRNKILASAFGVLMLGVVSGVVVTQFRGIIERPPASGDRARSAIDKTSVYTSGRRRRGNIEHGRYWLIGIFFALRAMDPFFYFGAIAEAQQQILGSILISTLWTTVLIVGIWNRKSWALYIMIALLIYGIIRDILPLVTVQIIYGNDAVSRFFLTGIVIRVIVTLILIASPDIKRLASNHHI